MARLPRLALAGHLHHVIQRGNNGQALFVDDADRRAYLDLLRESAAAHGVAIHAYALLIERVQLLATPQQAQALSLTMQTLGRRYVARFNRRHGRSGTLWEGRYRATVLEAERHFLRALIDIESMPVRLQWVVHAADWPWSSAAHHVGGARDPLVTPHALYWALGNTPFEREVAYRALLDAGVSEAEHAALTDAAMKGWALGGAAFIAGLAIATSRPLQPRQRGRPRKPPAA
jgi:putative transposase